MRILALDIGTTNCKAAVVSSEGTMESVSSKPTKMDPDSLWQSVIDCTTELVQGEHGIDAVAIVSMAETGLLIDLETQKPCSKILPWYDQCGYDLLCQHVGEDEFVVFQDTGLRLSHKYGVNKILWLKSQGVSFNNRVWLSAADYIAWKITGRLGTDYTLALRTYAFSMRTKDWNYPFLEQIGIPATLFPKVVPSGKPIGCANSHWHALTGIATGVPVSICGHDHIAAALSVGVVDDGMVFNSMGTAEVFLGAMKEKPLGRDEYQSGLSYGMHIIDDTLIWMGGVSASGGSVEWVRKIVSAEPTSYEELMDLLSKTAMEPTGILFFPFLSGPTALSNGISTGCFLGLTQDHSRAEVTKAVLEGICYEMEYTRQRAEIANNLAITELSAVGGGTKNPYWLQIKADVSGLGVVIPTVSEATLQGAALAVSRRNGLRANLPVSRLKPRVQSRVLPNQRISKLYREVFAKHYLPFRDSFLSSYYLKTARSDSL